MKYLILIHSNPASRAAWNQLTDVQRATFGDAHMRLDRQLKNEGVLAGSEGLQPPDTARWVSVRDGNTITSDGPFAEVKEHLAGYYLVEVATEEEAVAIAARVPDALFGEVEVRPVYDFSQWEP
jgi:hypothetical protein